MQLAYNRIGLKAKSKLHSERIVSHNTISVSRAYWKWGASRELARDFKLASVTTRGSKADQLENAAVGGVHPDEPAEVQWPACMHQ